MAAVNCRLPGKPGRAPGRGPAFGLPPAAGADELEIIEQLQNWRRQVIVVLTKADKLKKSRFARQQVEIAARLASGGVQPQEIIWFSAMTQEGRRELWERLLTVL